MADEAPVWTSETMPLLGIHGAALHAMADGEPEEAAQITAILARRIREAEAERDRYRAALERIYQQGRGPHVALAREALDAS